MDTNSSASPETMLLWIEIIREARQLAGASAARSIWRKSPLPALEIDPADEGVDLGTDETIRLFILERVMVTGRKGDVVTAGDLYTAFAGWQMDKTLPPAIGRMMFFRGISALAKTYRCPLTGHGFRRAKVSVSIYQGLVLVPSPLTPGAV